MEKEKVIIIAANINKNINDEIQELTNLCSACSMDVLEFIIQNIDNINSKTYLGPGKLKEVKALIDALEVDAIVANDELSPLQINNMQDLLDVVIYDRPYVILEIFKRRAKTKEAILQVDIASLYYLLPRLVGLRSNLSRQRGGGGNALHGRGGGETKLELDRRNIIDRIAYLKKELKILTIERQLQRKKRKRSNLPLVALVGYTNSGKSTTLNALLQYSKKTKKVVFTKDMPFATLETATRLIKLNNNHEFLIVDTIGFVHKLPFQLIEAFKSTLEEIKEADLILHIVDCSSRFYLEQINTTEAILKEIGVNNIPVLYVLNKIDKISDEFFIPPNSEDYLRISAKEQINLDQLIAHIEEALFNKEIIATFLIPYPKGEIVNLLSSESAIKAMKHTNEGTLITAQVSPALLAKLQAYEQKI